MISNRRKLLLMKRFPAFFSLCGVPESIDGAPKKENGQEKRKIAAHFCDIFGGILVESEDEKCYNKLIYYAHRRGWRNGSP